MASSRLAAPTNPKRQGAGPQERVKGGVKVEGKRESDWPRDMGQVEVE